MASAPTVRKRLPTVQALAIPSRQEAVAATLRFDILRGQVAAGARLDIDEIAARHGVSRTPVRDALKQLEAEGLVHVLPYRGVEVTRLSAEDLREIFAIRSALEQLAIAMAVQHITDAELGGLRRILKRMDRARGRDQSWTMLNASFHDAVHAASRSPRLIEMIRMQRTNVERYVRAGAADLGTAPQQAEHWEMLEALAARDAAAARAVIARHLDRTAETLAGLAGA